MFWDPASRYGSCLDGLDNDGDKLIDFDDSDCFGPNQSEAPYAGENFDVDTYGWTRLQPSADSRIIYVSNSEGSDSNSGESPAQPKKTLQIALKTLRVGYPDWLLLKRGDSWEEGLSIKWGGRSAVERMVISSYGFSDEPPLLKTGSSSGIGITGGGGAQAQIGNLAIVGLNLYAHTRDPNSPSFLGTQGGVGIQYLRPGHNFLIEDCQVSFYGVNLVIQAEGDGLFNFVLRRSRVLDGYNTDGHSQGIYMERSHGVLFEGNLFDHNGWAENGPGGAEATIFNHNLYIQGNGSGPYGNTDVVVKDNVIARAASHGLQLRPGGVVENNLFLRNSLAMFVGDGDSSVKGNIVLDAKDIRSDTPRGHGIAVINNSITALVENNIVANKRSSSAPWYEAYDLGANNEAAQHFVFRNNIAWNWNGPGLLVNATPNDSIDVSDNILQEMNFEQSIVYYKGPMPPSNVAFRNNFYFTKQSRPNWWFYINDHLYSFADWQGMMNDSSSHAEQVNFFDPSRTVESWQAALGGEASLEAFLSEARAQRKTNWRRNYTASPVLAYIREGFSH